MQLQAPTESWSGNVIFSFNSDYETKLVAFGEQQQLYNFNEPKPPAVWVTRIHWGGKLGLRLNVEANAGLLWNSSHFTI